LIVIIVYCHSGTRSAVATQFLVTNNHVNISNMLGGYSGWVLLPTRTPIPTATDTATPKPTVSADINEDGVVDYKDLLLFLQDWEGDL